MTTLTLGGSGDRPAVTWQGATWTYAQLADEIAKVPHAALLDTRSLGVVPTLAAMFAGIPVLVADPAAPAPQVGPLPPDAFLVAVTSGSSGRPRPIVRSARSWTESFAPLADLAGLRADDTVLLTGPLHSTLHLFAAVHTLAIGAHLTDQPGTATAVHAVPAVLAALLDTLPTSAPLRTAVVAGAALPSSVAERATSRGIAVTEYYGAAELSFVAARRVPDPFRPFPGVDVEVRDGEIWARSPYLAHGYADDVPGPLRRDSEGFATVGDLGSFDGQTLQVRGRGDAAITTGGHTVIAEDVEAVLLSLPGVRAAVALGTPHDTLGEIVTAVLELDGTAGGSVGSHGSGETRDAAGIALRAAARARLAGPALPRRWLTTDALPRTSGGKVARASVRAGLADGSLPVRPLP